MAERSQPGEDYDDLTYVKHIRSALAQIPRPVRWIICLAVLCYCLLYGQDWLFYGSLIWLGNFVAMKAEYWTAGRDAVAKAAGLRTLGWGIWPNAPLERFRQDREVRRVTGM